MSTTARRSAVAECLDRSLALNAEWTMSCEEAKPWTIRTCRPDEDERLLTLWRRAEATPSVTDTAEAIRRVSQTSSARVLVAETSGQVVGSIIGTFDGWRGNIYRLAVHPDYRRQGMARALVKEVERWLQDQGVQRITALVEKDHSWAVGFWEAVGYGVDQRIVRHVRSL
jgi:ribosomal protein S18 acetylase RimI-like enzyme